MSSTYSSLHFHIVFSTKHRHPLIADSWRKRLDEYMGGTLVGLGAVPQAINGVADHVHVLVDLKTTHCVADIVRELKKASSVWASEEIGLRDFAWQDGCAAFTVSSNAMQAVGRYITNQEAHHRRKSFQNKLIELLRRAGIEPDPRDFD